MSHFEYEHPAFDGLNLYFQGWKTEIEPKGVISLVHGLGEHSQRYTHWASLLNQAGYSVLAFDLRGHGKSAGKRGTVTSFNDFIEDVALLLSESGKQFPATSQFLYGHSLGAIIAAYFVLLRKPNLAGVVLTGLATRTPLREQKGKVLLAQVLGSIVPNMSMSTGLIPETISKDPEIVARYKNDPLVHHQASLGFARGSMAAIDWIDKHASEWTLPVLVMHGEEDKLGYASGSRDFVGNIQGDCTLKIWPNLFHEVHNEPEKEQVFEYLRAWLDSHVVS
jgi:alpha-beta hydrolase superfamily lysophospholipase